MGRLKINETLSLGKTVLIRGKPLEVLRAHTGRVGDLFTITDKRGRDFRARILTLTPRHSEAFVFESFEVPVEPCLEIHLIQALPKKERLEWIIQKTTELGVSSIVPCESDHSITLEERNSPQRKSHRWQGIATKAANQSRRPRVPVVYPTVPFRRALEIARESDLRLLLWEKESSIGIRRILVDLKDTARNLTLAVGPEGGFSKHEVEKAHECGFISVGLGPRILRTETAAVAALSILQYELGDLGGTT